MREIVFRGKRKDNGEWVYGDLLTERNKASKNTAIVFYDGYMIPKSTSVYKNTVGQYTGLNDSTKWEQLSETEQKEFYDKHCSPDGKSIMYKNIEDVKHLWKGKEIYEGDILHFKAYQGGGFWCPIGTDIYNKIVFTEHNMDCNTCSEYIGFMAMSPNGCLSSISYLVNGHKAEIISNIYDNPELLEVQR